MPATALDAEERLVLERWLQTQVGAPRLARGKMVFQQLGCLGCHRRGNVGGDLGPDLSAVGALDARDLDVDGASPETRATWLRRHLVEPATLSTWVRSALPSSPGGVPTAMKQTLALEMALGISVVKKSLPSSVLREISSSRPGS